MHYIIKGDEAWIPCTFKAVTPNVNLHNRHSTQWQTEPDLAAAPTSIVEIPKAAVATMIKTPLAGPRASAAADAMIKTPAPVAVGLTRMEMSDSSTNPGVITEVTSAR